MKSERTLKYTQKSITMAEYQLIMSDFIEKNKKKPVHETLIALIEEASKYRIVKDVRKNATH